MKHAAVALGLLLAAGCATTDPLASLSPADRADVTEWISITTALSADDMEGRDTGSPGHARAARYLARLWTDAGLKPAGDNGTWFQTLPLHEVRVEKAGTAFTIAGSGGETSLQFLHEISVRASEALPAGLDAPLSFRGYCSPAEMGADMTGKIAVCFGTRRAGMTTAAERTRAAMAAGAVGLINVDDPGFTIEPARWPDAYARAISIAPARPPGAEIPVMRLKADKLATVIAGSGQDAAAILKTGAEKAQLPVFDIPARLKATFARSTRDFTSENIVGLLPGTDPSLAGEYIVVSSHIDGYGHGEAVNGDTLYNGAFDDAAYTATLVRLAQIRKVEGFRRPVLFVAFTGEEKGLLGANWFVANPPVPKDQLAANINLDQIRPLFPLTIMTVHGLSDTTLGASVREVASDMSIEIRPDMEPERNLVSRADHWPFLRAGVPATGFVFGFDPGTEAERRYREWYDIRYHRPQDDMSQPMDVQAAADMNRFFYSLTETVANAADRPAFLPDSPLKPAP
jgi:Zn-dependent M28 family amino/carboxypeptidase